MADSNMPSRVFPFRRALAVEPYLLPINSPTTPVPVAISKTALTAAGVTSFKIYNPCPFWVWYRGWNGAVGTMPTIAEKGHYLPPGAVDINTSQLPDYIAAIGQAEPSVPLPSDLATAGYRLVMIYGSGM